MMWFAACLLTVTAVICAVNRRDDRGKTEVVFGAPTPAHEPLSWQVARAQQPGRGRKASAPMQIPWRGWLDILARTYRETRDDRLMALSAGVVFYSLVALFPAIAAGVSCYALFADAGTISKHLALVADVVPAGALDMLRDEIARIAARATAG